MEMMKLDEGIPILGDGKDGDYIVISRKKMNMLGVIILYQLASIVIYKVRCPSNCGLSLVLKST